MRRSALLLPLLLLMLAIPHHAAESANKLLERYRKAAGGAALKRIKATLVSASVTSSNGEAGRFDLRAVAPDRLRIDIATTETKVIECYNGKSAWTMDRRGLRTLLGLEAKRMRLDALIINSRLVNLSRNRIVAQAPTKATFEGRNVNILELIKDQAHTKLYFDAETGLLIKRERERAEGIEELYYTDYRKVDGVMEPFAIRIKNGDRELLISVDRVEHDGIVEEAAFRYPTIEGQRPLPDLAELMKAIEANQEKVEDMVDHYTFRETVVERKDNDGHVTEGDTKVYEVTPVYGTPVRKLVSVNGKPLSQDDREKEDRRVQKAVEEIVKKHEKEEKREKKKEEAKSRGEKGDEDDDDLTLLDFLRISEITSVRREVFRDHEVIAFDFEPRKGFKPKNRGESLVNKLAGTMWADEDAKQIVRAEARLVDSFKIGGGLLASVSPATAVVFEQEKIGDEIWLPSYNEVNLSARLFLFAKLKLNFVSRFSDYKKYQIDDKYELGKPTEAAKPAKP